jgi:hypothetical protein
MRTSLLTLEQGPSKEQKATLQVVLAYLDYLKVFESYIDTSSN